MTPDTLAERIVAIHRMVAEGAIMSASFEIRRSQNEQVDRIFGVECICEFVPIQAPVQVSLTASAEEFDRVIGLSKS